MWGAVETARERDLKLSNTASKVDNNIPYNAFRTDKIIELVKTNVYANMQQKAKQTTDLLKSNFGKEAINKTIQAAKNFEIITSRDWTPNELEELLTTGKVKGYEGQHM